MLLYFLHRRMTGDRHNYSTGKKERPEVARGRGDTRAEAVAALDLEGLQVTTAVGLRVR